MDTVIVLPIHLFEKPKIIDRHSHVLLWEHPLFFTKYKYHKLKLIYHRATMKSYEHYLKTKIGCTVRYINYYDSIDEFLKKDKHKQVNIYDPVDFDVMTNLKIISKRLAIDLQIHDSPLYLCSSADLEEYLQNGGLYRQTSFYIWQRKRLNILMTSDGKPEHGKWTFDKENRLPFPAFGNFTEPTAFKTNKDPYTEEAKAYVEKHFKENVGATDLYLPINHKDAKAHLTKFIKQRLSCFGPYEDASSPFVIFGCHSVLSPIMNIGLLTHKYVIDQVLKYYNIRKRKKTAKNIPIASVEGFIRQIVGWANYMRFVYVYKHKELIAGNHFRHYRKIEEEWYRGETGIQPIDDIIQKTLKYGYAHHIERLMYLGNFMLLSRFAPKDIHDWFMTMFVDSYHVFMETNVYGMSQYSCGPILSTRPYFSSSNYIRKMGRYANTGDWNKIWDALYYYFINAHKKEFAKNYAIASAVKHLALKSVAEKNELFRIAKSYLKKNDYCNTK